jgi:hypothetical protein
MPTTYLKGREMLMFHATNLSNPSPDAPAPQRVVAFSAEASNWPSDDSTWADDHTTKWSCEFRSHHRGIKSVVLGDSYLANIH